MVHLVWNLQRSDTFDLTDHAMSIRRKLAFATIPRLLYSKRVHQWQAMQVLVLDLLLNTVELLDLALFFAHHH